MVDIFIDKFKGIRAVNPIVDVVNTGSMSAVDCKNIGLKYSNNGNNVGIYTMKGNSLYASLAGKVIRGSWESVQAGVRLWFVYATDEENGYLYSLSPSSRVFTLVQDGLTKTDLCNGITVANGLYDWFVFTNGVDDYLGIRIEGGVVTKEWLNATDAEERDIRGLCLKYYDGRLVTNSGNRVHWSKQADIFDWSTATPGVVTNPAYQEFDRAVTAIEYYNNYLIAFTDTYSVAFSGNPGDATNFSRTGAAGGGCASFNAEIKYDNKLYYYDHIAKNIFAYYLYDSGQQRPTDGLANEVFEFFNEIDGDKIGSVAMLGFSIGDKNEILINIPTKDEQKTLVLDYLKGEWLERDDQHINGFTIYDSTLYSMSENSIYEEYKSRQFSGSFRPAEYKMNIINLGSDTNLKIPKMPLTFTFDSSYNNNFYIDFRYDDDPKKVRTKHIVRKSTRSMMWAVDDTETDKTRMWAEDLEDDEHGYWSIDEKRNITYNLTGLLNFKQLQMRLYTTELGEEFGIKRIELKRVKIKTKTTG